MNTRKLLKEIGWKSTGKVVDYLGVRIDEDRPDLLKEVQSHCESAKFGDVVSIVVIRFPKKKK